MSTVKIYEKKITIPTYEVQEADKNPMFLEKRVYQASKGSVYPYPFIEKVSDEKVDKEYNVIYLENEYISLMMMPELGGRIQYGYDKINDYDFFYKNSVIKPALVGLSGPWISGGVEFNWPQHHRPSTYDRVEYEIIENKDGSMTLVMGEIEQMSRMIGQVRITVYPGRSYVEVKGTSYNNTAMPANFLWWANIAVHVHDKYESFFPQDVKYVADHGKRDMTSYPYADNVYYNVDYPSMPKEKRNITNYDNIPVPMSYMAMGSDFDFFGGYDYKKDMGTLYISNHHTAPGKKQWTWGNGDFGQAWDRQLTDEDGPYAELMAGAYTDNQPDFTWINPYEKKTFNQYWYPFKKQGKVKNANLKAIVNIDYQDSQITYTIGTPIHLENAKYEVYYKDEVLETKEFSLTPKCHVIEGKITKDIDDTIGLGVRVFDESGKEIIDFHFENFTKHDNKKAAIEAKKPEEIESNDELFNIGTHLEQYRHATYDPDDYYLEILKRDESDTRANTAYGMLLLKRHEYKLAIPYFEKAIEVATKYNPNPKNSEMYYGLGLCKYYGKDYDDAYDAFYKAIWDYSQRSSSYTKIAQIDMINGDAEKAKEHCQLALQTNYDSTKIRNLYVKILLKLGETEKALSFAKESLELNPLSYLIIRELDIMNGTDKFEKLLFNNSKSYLEVALEYAEFGAYTDAIDLLKSLDSDNPSVLFFIGHYSQIIGNQADKKKFYNLADSANKDYCFPHRIEEKIMLEDILMDNQFATASYILDNLLYDKKSYKEAIKCFEDASKLDPTNAIAFRNLGIAYFNIEKDVSKAVEAYEKAHEIDGFDGRILYELDQLYKITNKDIAERISYLERKMDVVKTRDDLYIEYISLTNELGNYEEALKLLSERNFHPFEGGEGKVADQYKFANIELAKKLMREEQFNEAIVNLENAKVFPHNLGEGKIQGTPEADINYLLGMCYKNTSDMENYKKHIMLSETEVAISSSNLSYKPEKLQMEYYRGLSLIENGKNDEAKRVFQALIDHHHKKSQINAEIDFFAISVPEFLIFEVNLNDINKSHCYYVMALAYHGLGDDDKAKEYVEMSVEINTNNYEAQALKLSI